MCRARAEAPLQRLDKQLQALLCLQLTHSQHHQLWIMLQKIHPRWLQPSDMLSSLFNMSSETVDEAVGALIHVEAVKKAASGQL